MKVVLLSVLAASLSCQVSGHAYIYWPTSREAFSPEVLGIKTAPYSFNNAVVRRNLKDRFGPKLSSKHGAGEGGAMPKKADDWSKNGDGCSGLTMTTAPVANYTEGQEIEVVIPVNSEHGGEYEFRLCTKKWDTMYTDKEHLECLDQHLLYRKCVNGPGCSCKSDRCRGKIGHTDPNDPIYTKHKNTAPLTNTATEAGGYLLKMKLPAGVACQYCTLQWYWFTAWSEEWWGCSDIAIRPRPIVDPTEPPTPIVEPTPPATPTPAPITTSAPITSAPTPAPTPSPDTAGLEKRVARLEYELKRLRPLEMEVKMLKAMVMKLLAGGGSSRRRSFGPVRRRFTPGPGSPTRRRTRRSRR